MKFIDSFFKELGEILCVLFQAHAEVQDEKRETYDKFNARTGYITSHDSPELAKAVGVTHPKDFV